MSFFKSRKNLAALQALLVCVVLHMFPNLDPDLVDQITQGAVALGVAKILAISHEDNGAKRATGKAPDHG